MRQFFTMSHFSRRIMCTRSGVFKGRLASAGAAVALLREELPGIASSVEALENHPEAFIDARKAKELHRKMGERDEVEDLISNFDALAELWDEEDDELSRDLEELEDALECRELAAVFNDKLDECSAFVTIVAGAGGDDARQWAGMVAQMYQNWGRFMDWEVEVVDVSCEEGADDVGAQKMISADALYRSCTLKFIGYRAFGHFRAEAGSHRLVRVSPFSSQGKRHTAFAAVTVYPSLDDDDAAVNLDPRELVFDTFKSSGPGGQSVNTTDSAVRVTHLPTGVTVKCQNQRSQHQNKATALQLLKARVLSIREEEKERARRDSVERGTVGDASFGGSHIRSYVLHPYKLVKCARTGWQTSDVEAFLSGDQGELLKECVFASLQQQLRQQRGK